MGEKLGCGYTELSKKKGLMTHAGKMRQLGRLKQDKFSSRNP